MSRSGQQGDLVPDRQDHATLLQLQQLAYIPCSCRFKRMGINGDLVDGHTPAAQFVCASGQAVRRHRPLQRLHAQLEGQALATCACADVGMRRMPVNTNVAQIFPRSSSR